MNNDIRELDINELDAFSGGISTGDEVASSWRMSFSTRNQRAKIVPQRGREQHVRLVGEAGRISTDP